MTYVLSLFRSGFDVDNQLLLLLFKGHPLAIQLPVAHTCGRRRARCDQLGHRENGSTIWV
jgi:hypothetical protein